MARTRKTASHRAVELGLAAPQVIAHRVARMALAGGTLSTRDRKEFTGMVMEKQQAFLQSWMAGWQAMWRAQLSLWTWAWRQSGAVTNAALIPIHGKAVSNARRLARTPLLAPGRRR